MTDYSKPLPVDQVEAWCRRLVASIAANKIRVGNQQFEPLSAQFLRHYLDNRSPNSTFEFQPPPYVKTAVQVLDVQRFHRAVFLSQEKARVGKGRTVLAGVLPRLRDSRWKPGMQLRMRYQSLVEIGGSFAKIVRLRNRSRAQGPIAARVRRWPGPSLSVGPASDGHLAG